MKIDLLLMVRTSYRIVEIINDSQNPLTSQDISRIYRRPPPVKKYEVQAAIDWSLETGLIEQDSSGTLFATSNDLSALLLSNKVELVVSKPRNMELLLGETLLRYGIIEMGDAFIKIIQESKDYL